MNVTSSPARRGPTFDRRGEVAGPAVRGLVQLGALTRAVIAAVRDFLVAVAQARPRAEMRQLAAQCAHTDPAMAARLRAGARSDWPE